MWVQRATDAFTRIDENPIQAPWILGAGGLGRLFSNGYSNRLGIASFDVAVYNLALPSGDQKIKATAKRVTSAATPIITLGLRSSNDLLTNVSINCGNGLISIFVSNVLQGAAIAQVINVNDVVEFQIVGNQTTISINGGMIDTRAVAAPPATGKAFIGAKDTAGTGDWDDFFVYTWVPDGLAMLGAQIIG